MDLSKRLHLRARTGPVVHLLQLLAHCVMCNRPDDRTLCALDVLQFLSYRHGHLGNIQREAFRAARQRTVVAALHVLPLRGRASPSTNVWIKTMHSLSDLQLHLRARTGSVVHLLQLLAHGVVCDRPDDQPLRAGCPADSLPPPCPPRQHPKGGLSCCSPTNCCCFSSRHAFSRTGITIS